MSPSVSKVQQFILCALVPIICSVAVGYIFFQDSVFHRTHGSFQFVWSAFAASVFYYLLVFVRPRDAYLGLILLLLLTFFATQSTRAAYILRDIFYIGAIGATVMIYFRYFKEVSERNVGYSAVMLAGIYGVVFIVCAEIHFWLLRTLGMEHTGAGAVEVASSTAFFGVLIGFATGAGITIARVLFGQNKNP